MSEEALGAAVLERVPSSNALHIHNALHLFRAAEEERRRTGVSSASAHFSAAASRPPHRPHLNLLIKRVLDAVDD